MKKKCHVLDCTGESLPVLDLSEWMNDNVGYLYLFGSWEKMQQMSAILSERHAKRRKPRVVAVIYGKPCGNIPGVDRWFCLSQEVMPPERIQSFLQTLQQRLGRF